MFIAQSDCTFSFLFGLLRSVYACLFDASRQKETACGILRFYSAHRAAGVERSHGILRSSAVAGLLVAVRFFVRRRGNDGLTVWRFCLLHGILALLSFPQGVRWGCAPQTRAKEPLALWTLLSCGRLGYQKLKTYQKAARHNHHTAFIKLGYYGDLPDSDLWSGKSCGRSTIL